MEQTFYHVKIVASYIYYNNFNIEIARKSVLQYSMVLR